MRGAVARERALPGQASIRLWILTVAVASFATGMLVGSVVPELVAASAAPSPDEGYVAEMVRTFGLSSEQERRLRLVLQNQHEEEIAILRSLEASRLSPAQNARLLRLRSETEQRIRYVLDERQRLAYEQRSRPASTAGSEPAPAAAVGDPR